jgi:hypothetical protein
MASCERSDNKKSLKKWTFKRKENGAIGKDVGRTHNGKGSR